MYLFLKQPKKLYHPPTNHPPAPYILIYSQYSTLQNPLYVEKQLMLLIISPI